MYRCKIYKEMRGNVIQSKTNVQSTLSTTIPCQRKGKKKKAKLQEQEIGISIFRDTVLQLSEDALKRIDKPLLNMLKFWLRGKRKQRRLKNYAERDPHPIGKVEHQKAQSVASD